VWPKQLYAMTLGAGLPALVCEKHNIFVLKQHWSDIARRGGFGRPSA
jgi:hypothetical protein